MYSFVSDFLIPPETLIDLRSQDMFKDCDYIIPYKKACLSQILEKSWTDISLRKQVMCTVCDSMHSRHNVSGQQNTEKVNTSSKLDNGKPGETRGRKAEGLNDYRAHH